MGCGVYPHGGKYQLTWGPTCGGALQLEETSTRGFGEELVCLQAEVYGKGQRGRASALLRARQ